MNSFSLKDDHTKCAHKFIVGPQRRVKDLHVGHCDACRNEVAIQLDAAGERTGKSWLIEYRTSDSASLDHSRLKTQRVDGAGTRNAVDDVLTSEKTDDLPMEDLHEKLDEGGSGK